VLWSDGDSADCYVEVGDGCSEEGCSLSCTVDCENCWIQVRVSSKGLARRVFVFHKPFWGEGEACRILSRTAHSSKIVQRSVSEERRGAQFAS